MANLAPRETKNLRTPIPIEKIVLRNDSMYGITLTVAVESDVLEVVVRGVVHPAAEVAPARAERKSLLE